MDDTAKTAEWEQQAKQYRAAIAQAERRGDRRAVSLLEPRLRRVTDLIDAAHASRLRLSSSKRSKAQGVL